jgi:mRNA-degrading endonuclease RelE of RelBE toxin-antitoxin system
MPQEYAVVFLTSAVETITALNRGEQRQILNQCKKLRRAPTLGEAMGNHALDLTGCRRLRAGRLRIVYEVDDQERTVTVVAVGAREDKAVYQVAETELGRHRLHRIS